MEFNKSLISYAGHGIATKRCTRSQPIWFNFIWRTRRHFRSQIQSLSIKLNVLVLNHYVWGKRRRCSR